MLRPAAEALLGCSGSLIVVTGLVEQDVSVPVHRCRSSCNELLVPSFLRTLRCHQNTRNILGNEGSLCGFGHKKLPLQIFKIIFWVIQFCIENQILRLV